LTANLLAKRGNISVAITFNPCYDIAMSSLPCDVVLLPSAELASKAMEASKSLSKKYNSFFTLEDGKYYPHMSLYMFQLNEDDIPKVKDILAEVAKSFSAVSAKAITYRLGEGFGVGYVDPEYEVTDELRALQDTVIEAINPVRAGMRESDIKKMQDAEGLKLGNLQKYGYPAVGKLFRPHLTLTRLKEHNPEALIILPDINSFGGLFDRIGLFEMGDNGTCVRKIAELKLR
jgi:2'-5' RNA ligase